MKKIFRKIKKGIQKNLLKIGYFRDIALQKAQRIESQYEFKEIQNEKERIEYLQLRYEVYCKEKEYLPKENFLNGLEEDKYDKSSKHFIVKNKETSEVVGAARLILNTQTGVQAGEYISLPEYIEKEEIVEVSRFIVKKNHRGGNHEINFILGKGLFEYSTRNKIDYWIAVMFTNTWRIFSNLGIPFVTIEKPQIWTPAPKYNVFPLLMRLSECQTYLEKTNPFFYSLFFNKKSRKTRFSEKEIMMIMALKKKMQNDKQKYWDLN